MFNKKRLQDALASYKENFIGNHWRDEKYKWEAVKHFQDNWDVNVDDFAAMLEKSLSKTANLLASMSNFPAKMITIFAQRAPEEVRAMFIELFDEKNDIVDRISNFKEQSDKMLEKYGNGAGNHFQRENSISTYLWLRFPDKYYIYKYSEIKTVAEELQSNYIIKKGAYSENIRNFYKFYDEICETLKGDSELINLLKSQLNEKCYPDPELRTLTIDVGFYISRHYSKIEDMNGWSPIDYSPEISVDEWVELINNPEVFTEGSLEIMKRFKDYGGQATCTQLSIKYGETKNFYNSGSTALAKRVAEKTGCPMYQRENGNIKYWSVLYQGKDADDDEAGSFIWKLRDELSKALEKVDLSMVKLYAEPENDIEEYTKDDFLNEVYMTENKYDRLVSVLKNKKNIILQGAPGVGKTFAAKRLAYSIIGKKDESKIEFVQFHQNYSYEDFMMGYKPVEDGFELRKGIFYNFCKTASNNLENDYFFIIDEINRGNMSKIFGELLMLIEKDYRGKNLTLAYNGTQFNVPENIYIIGMMNTADRSLAMIDYALRRRFSFFTIESGFDSEGFVKYQKSLNNETFNFLIEKVKELNKEISLDKSLGKGFCIGHSYFCGQVKCTDEWLQSVVDYDILPMLEEYWFDDAGKLQRWENILHGIFQ